MERLDNVYRYNGMELDEATGHYDSGVRYYDPAVARWGQVDPVTELATDLTPYRYGFNNPISFIDPNGLFESRAAARQYRRENGSWWGGDRIRKQDDGSFAVENKNSGAITFEFTDDDGDKSIISGAINTGRALHFSDLSAEERASYSNMLSENYNPNAEIRTDLSDIAYALGSLLGLASPSSKVLSSASNASKAVTSTVQSTSKLDDFITSSSRVIIPRAPSGGILVNGKYYKGGQFLPGARTTLFYGRGGVPGHGLLRGTPTYPLPATGYPQLSTGLKWGIGIGGSSLAFKYGWDINVSGKIQK